LTSHFQDYGYGYEVISRRNVLPPGQSTGSCTVHLRPMSGVTCVCQFVFSSWSIVHSYLLVQ